MGLGDLLGTSDDFKAKQAAVDARNFTYGNSAGAGTGQKDLGAQQSAYGAQGAEGYQNQLGARQGQQSLAQLLAQQAAGNGPSAAQGVLQQGANQAGINAMSAARMASGNPAQQAAATNQAAMAGAMATQQAGGQAAQIRSQEQLAAQQGLASLYGQQRSQDLQGMGLSQQGQLGYLGAGMQASLADLQARQAYEQLQSGNFNTAQGIDAATAQFNAQQNAALVAGAMGAAGGAAKFLSDERAKYAVHYGRGNLPSDERLKDHLPGGHTLADAFLERLHPASYRYRDPSDEPTSHPNGGQYLGVMAQDVERTPHVGSQLVHETEHGKMLEIPATMSAILAGVGRLHERIAQLERERGK